MRTKMKKRICAAVGAVCLLAVLGVVGGMDVGTIRLGAGAAWSFGLLAAETWLLWKAGVIKFG